MIFAKSAGPSKATVQENNELAAMIGNNLFYTSSRTPLPRSTPQGNMSLAESAGRSRVAVQENNNTARICWKRSSLHEQSRPPIQAVDAPYPIPLPK